MPESQTKDTTYRAHAEDATLIVATHAFIARQRLNDATRILDLACGTGIVSEALLEAAPNASLNGVDLDPAHVELCGARFERLGFDVRHGFALTDERVHDKPAVTFGVGSADDLPFPDATFDCVTIANAIHLLPDKPKLIEGVARVLKPGGVLGFTTAFYAGALPKQTHMYYTEWLKESMLYINALSEKRIAMGESEIRRVRGKGGPAFRNRWYSAEQWRAMLGDAGLNAHDVLERTLMLDGDFFATIGAYSGLAETLMSGYPVDVACEAMSGTAQSTMDSLGLTAVPRNWLEVWATRP